MQLFGKGNRPFKDNGNGMDDNAPKKPISPETIKKNQRYLIITMLNTVIFAGAYFYLNYLEFRPTFFIYALITTLAVLGYLIYNRGFSRSGITIDMLPDTMSQVEKEDFLACREIWHQKSKWLLTIIIPCILTFAFDMVILFVIPYFENLFS